MKVLIKFHNLIILTILITANKDTEGKDSIEERIKQAKQEIKELEKEKHDLEIVGDTENKETRLSDGELKVWAEKVILKISIFKEY